MCNCDEDATCPLGDKCLEKNIIYQADVTCKDENNKKMNKKIYYGLTERTFKARYNEHTCSFRNEKENKTTLSSYVWYLKNRGLKPEITWSIKARGHVFSSGGRQCDLCLTEKLVITKGDPKEMLNKRDEILQKCRHKRKFTLAEVKPP